MDLIELNPRRFEFTHAYVKSVWKQCCPTRGHATKNSNGGVLELRRVVYAEQRTQGDGG